MMHGGNMKFVAVMFGKDRKELLLSSLAPHHYHHHRSSTCYDEIYQAYIHVVFGFGWLANQLREEAFRLIDTTTKTGVVDGMKMVNFFPPSIWRHGGRGGF